MKTAQLNHSEVLVAPPCRQVIGLSAIERLAVLIQFDSAELRAMCEDLDETEAAFGDSAGAVIAALADLRAAPTLGSIPKSLIREHEKSSHTFSLDTGCVEIYFQQNHKKPPVNESLALELDQVSRVRIIRVEAIDD